MIDGIFGYENSSILYEGVDYYKVPDLSLYVSKRGTIVSYKDDTAIFKKPIYINRNGYQYISYHGHIIYVHRLVALTFGLIDNLNTKLDIDHINNVRGDNRLSNLQAITHAENIKKRDENGNFNDKPVIFIKGNEILFFKSQSKAAEYFVVKGISKGTIKTTKERISVQDTYYGWKKFSGNINDYINTVDEEENGNA